MGGLRTLLVPSPLPHFVRHLPALREFTLHPGKGFAPSPHVSSYLR